MLWFNVSGDIGMMFQSACLRGPWPALLVNSCDVLTAGDGWEPLVLCTQD